MTPPPVAGGTPGNLLRRLAEPISWTASPSATGGGVILFWLSSFLSFLLYLKTLYPTVGPGDSGELITAAYTLGIAHPPGYPLYCLLGKLFSFLPVGTIAYRLNLMSAVFASLTVGMVYLLAEEFLGRFGKVQGQKVLAFGVSFLFAFSKDFWAQALSAEVYTLHLFFLTLILWLFLKWDRSHQKGLFSLGVFLTGLGLTNHHTLLMILPPCFLWIAMEEPGFFRDRRRFILSCLFFFLPLLVYLYLPLRSDASFVWAWPGGRKGFLYHILRRQYYENPNFLPPPRSLWIYGLQVLSFLRVLGEQIPKVLWPAVWVGGVRLFWKSGKLSLLVGLYFLETLLLIILGHYEPTESMVYLMRPFFIPQTLFVCLLVGLFFQMLLGRFSRVPVKAGVFLALFAGALSSIFSFYPSNDRSWRTLAYDYGLDLFDAAPAHAFLVLSGDDANFDAYYLRFVEGKRKDLTIFSAEHGVFPAMSDEAFIKSWQTLKKENPLLCLYTNSLTLTFSGEPPLVQEGLLRRTSAAGRLPERGGSWPAYRADLEPYFSRGDFVERLIASQYLYAKANTFLREGKIDRAKAELKEISRLSEEVDDMHSDLGFFYLERGWTDEAQEEFRKTLSLTPFHSEAKKELGIALGLSGDYRHSAQLLKETYDQRPRDPELSFNLGVSLGNLGYFTEAYDWFRHTASLDPEYPGIQAQMKRARELAGQ